MNLKNKIRDILRINGSAISEEIKAELKEQGHVHTGKLINSVKAGTSINGDEVSLNVTMLDYHVYLEHGVKASRIPFGGRRSGKKRSKYIEALINYFRQKGKSEKEAKGAAFATAHKHKREGMPTRSSYQYSANNRRTEFINESTKVSKNIDKVGTDILEATEYEANLFLNNFEKAVR